VVVKPVTDDDVAKIVRIRPRSLFSQELIAFGIQITYAANSRTPFLSTGRGHGFTITLEKLRNGFALDLSNFNHVSVDDKANTLKIGGAVRFRDVVGPLGRARKELRESPQLPIASTNY
jgi:FAD/FMN-containing dehydrogenase